jgi:hypothetical protein
VFGPKFQNSAYSNLTPVQKQALIVELQKQLRQLQLQLLILLQKVKR